MQPAWNPLTSHIVYSGAPGMIRDSIINGRIVMKNRKVTGAQKVISDFNRIVGKWFKEKVAEI